MTNQIGVWRPLHGQIAKAEIELLPHDLHRNNLKAVKHKHLRAGMTKLYE